MQSLLSNKKSKEDKMIKQIGSSTKSASSSSSKSKSAASGNIDGFIPGSGKQKDASFQKLYNKDYNFSQCESTTHSYLLEQIPVVLHELNDAAICYINKQEYEKALFLLQKAHNLYDVSLSQWYYYNKQNMKNSEDGSRDSQIRPQSRRDKMLTFITFHNMALCYQKLSALQQCSLCLEGALLNLQVALSPMVDGGATFAMEFKRIKIQCKIHMQTCAILSQLHWQYLTYNFLTLNNRHKEALKHARMGAKLSQKLIKKLLQLCTSFKHLVHGQVNEDMIQKLRYPRSFSLQDSVSLVQKNSEKLYPILKQLVKRLVPEKHQYQGHQGTVTTNFTGDPVTGSISNNKKISSIVTNKHGSIQSNNDQLQQQLSKRKGSSILAYDDAKIDMRNLLGYVNQNQWISSLNIGNIMQISPISANELLTYTHNEVQLTRDVILQKLKQDPSYDPVSKLKQSQYWHAKSLQIVCSFLPSDCPLLNHILLSYQKHHSPSQQTIPEDGQAQVGVSVLRPLEGIQAQKFQPIIRSIQGLNFILSPAQTPRGYFAELEVELDDDDLQELEQVENGPLQSNNQTNNQQQTKYRNGIRSKSDLSQNQDNGGDDQMNASIDIDLGQNDSFSLQAQFLAKDRSQSSFTKHKPVPPTQNFPPGRQSNRSIKSANKIMASSAAVNQSNLHHNNQISDNNNILNTEPSQVKSGKIYQKQQNPQRKQNSSSSVSLSKHEQRQRQARALKKNNKTNNRQDDGEQSFMSDGLEQDSLLQNISVVKPSTAAAGAKRHNSTGADIRSDQKNYLLHHNASVTSGMTMAGGAQKNISQIQKRPSSTQQHYNSQNDKIFQPKRNLHSALGTNIKYQSKIMPSHSQQLRPQSAKRKNLSAKSNNSLGEKGRAINNSFSNANNSTTSNNTSFQQLNQSLQQQMIDYGNKSSKLYSGNIPSHQLVASQQQQQFNLANGIQNKKLNFPNTNNNKKIVTSALPRKGNMSLHHYEELKSKLINQYKAQRVLRQHTNVTNDKKNLTSSNTHTKQQKIPASLALGGNNHQGSNHHMGGRSSSQASSNFMNKRNHIAFRVFNQNKSPNPGSHRNLSSNQSHSQLQQMNVSVIQGQVGSELFEPDSQSHQQKQVNRSFQIQGQQGAHHHNHSQQQRGKTSSPFNQGFVMGKSHGSSGGIGRKNDKKIASIYSHHGGSSSPFESESGAKKGSRGKLSTGGGTNIVGDLNVAMEKHFKKASNQALKFLMN